MPRFVLAFALAAGLAGASHAQGTGLDAPDRPLVVMNLAAHPDDEDGLTMAYYRGHQDAVVYSVVFTRGEGGQNEAGPDLYERLGAIRTAETEAAARILGTRVTYLDRFDFGYSKHASEAFAEWSAPRTGFWEPRPDALDAQAGRDALVADVVRAIRRFRPDVLFTNHDTTTAGPDTQHGHHQAVGLATLAAFSLAADPGYRPDQLAEPGLALWQPSRLFLRQGGFLEEAPRAYQVAVPVGDACAPTATRPTESCADRAVAAAAQHVSQGFDTFAPRFRRDTTYFSLVAQAPGVPALPAGAADLAVGLAANPHAADLDLATLVDSGRLAPLAGLAAQSATVVPSQSAYLSWPAGDGRQSITVEPPPGAPARGLFAARPQTAALDAGSLRVAVPSGTPPTLPAFRAQYGTGRGTAPLLYAVRDADGGLVAGGRLPVQIAPPATVDLDPAPIRLTGGRTEVPVSLIPYDATRDTVLVGLTVYDATDRAAWFAVAPVAAADAEHTFSVDLEGAAPGRYRVVAEARTSGCGLPWFRAERPAVILPDVAVAPGLRVGFVRSYDGTMGEALRVMGAEVTDLDAAALAGDLSGFDTIVIDIRATLERDDLRERFPRLLDWVEGGGHLVVGYHKTFEWNDGAERYAPYPLRLGRDRVTDETAAVTVLRPEHPLFHTPHALTAADWDGWVQERGLYFPAEADARYERLVALADPGEDALTTGLLLGHHGQGTYLYSSLVWYRQLAALAPGAWRAFANLVSLPLVAPGGTP